MSDDRSAEQELLAAHQRRLQTLELQAARFGVDTPAHIAIEIDDLKATIAALQQRLNPRTSPASASGRFRVWVVDQMHRGDHLTIADAVAAASPGDRILVRPGVYDEALTLDKPLDLIGEGEPGDVLIQAGEASAIHFNCARGLVKNLTIRQSQGGEWALFIARGRLDLEDCDISSAGNGAVLIAGSAHPRLRRNRIHDNAGNGVYITRNAQGLLEDNEIFNHSNPAVGIDNGASPTLRKNRIHDNESNGIWITGGGGGTFEHNTLYANKRGNWNIERSCLPNVKRTGNSE